MKSVLLLLTAFRTVCCADTKRGYVMREVLCGLTSFAILILALWVLHPVVSIGVGISLLGAGLFLKENP